MNRQTVILSRLDSSCLPTTARQKERMRMLRRLTASHPRGQTPMPRPRTTSLGREHRHTSHRPTTTRRRTMCMTHRLITKPWGNRRRGKALLRKQPHISQTARLPTHPSWRSQRREKKRRQEILLSKTMKWRTISTNCCPRRNVAASEETLFCSNMKQRRSRRKWTVRSLLS